MPVHRVQPDESVVALDPRPICPRCNRPVGDRRTPGESLCTPINCDAWKVEATWDKQRRRWVYETVEWQHEHDGQVIVADAEQWSWPDGAVTLGERVEPECDSP